MTDLQSIVDTLNLNELDYFSLLSLYDSIENRYQTHMEKAALYAKLRAAVENRILDKLHEDKLDRVTIGNRTMIATSQVVPRAVDWAEIERWMFDHRRWLAHHRLSSKAVLALLEEDPNALPSGIVLDRLAKLSIRKVRQAKEL